MMRDIADWQRRYRAARVVWAVEDRDGCTSNLYETKESAQLEVDRLSVRGDRLRVVKHHVHTDELAEERWGALKDERGG